MKYQSVVLSEEALAWIVGDMHLSEDDLAQVRIALENIRLEKKVEETPMNPVFEIIGPINDHQVLTKLI